MEVLKSLEGRGWCALKGILKPWLSSSLSLSPIHVTQPCVPHIALGLRNG
jgi:hypothetical protein